MDNQPTSLRNWGEFQDYFRRVFPFISEEYWSSFPELGNVHDYIDWDQVGRFAMGPSWADSDESREFIKNLVQHNMKDSF